MDLNQAREVAIEAASRVPPATEAIALENALGRIAAESFKAPRGLPPQARSRLDGFAVRGDDTIAASEEQPVILEITRDVLAAGHSAPSPLRPGRAMKIFTGAPLPEGADAVIAIERVERRDNELVLKAPMRPGRGVISPGSDAREGEILVSPGERLNPQRLGAMAAFGTPSVEVFQIPAVALLSTGDEVLELGEAARGASAYCDTRHLWAWLVASRGGHPEHLGIARDDPEDIARRLDRTDAAMAITTGGTGAGGRDFLREAWNILGVRILFDGVNLSPGGHTLLGKRGGRLFWAVSGNPWPARVVFGELIAPALMTLAGANAWRPPLCHAVVAEPLGNETSRHRAIMGRIELAGPGYVFQPSGRTGKSRLRSMVEETAYLLLEPFAETLPAGSPVQVRTMASY